jgi:hypothetical protein
MHAATARSLGVAVLIAICYCSLVVVAARGTDHPTSSIQSNVDRTLRLRQDGSFKIVQFADIHFGEGEDVWWGPAQDTNSTRVMRAVLRAERPDLVIFSGDQITGNNIHSNATRYWAQLLQPCIEGGYRWAAVFGNHDDLADGTGGRRRDLMKFDTSFPLSLSQFGPSSLHGVSNYYLPILPHSPGAQLGSEPFVSLLYLFDTGGGHLPEIVDKAQVDWYRNLSATLRPAAGPVPALAFFHIPLERYSTIFSPGGKDCFGEEDDGVSPVDTSNGLFDAFLEMGDVKATFVGHDHGNDWCCLQKGVHLCFGRHSGYGGYGTWARGARVIELRRSPQYGDVTAKTWVRMEDGGIQDGGPLF